MAVTQAQVAQLYVALFNRAPEGDGFRAWVNLGANKTQSEIAQLMLESQAARDYYNGSIDSDRDYIELIYKNILGKDYTKDPDGINAWVMHLQAGNTRGETLIKLFEVAQSAEARAADPVAAAVFDNKTAISAYMAEKIAGIQQDLSGNYDYRPFQEIIKTTTATNLEEQRAKVDALASSTIHNLSTDTNDITGTVGQDIFNAVADSLVSNATLKPTDKIDGGSGENTLNVRVNDDFNGMTTGYIKNIDNLNLTSNASTAKTFNARGIEGLKRVTLDSQNGLNLLNPKNIVDVSLENLKSNVDKFNLNYNTDTIAGVNDSQNLTLDNVNLHKNAITGVVGSDDAGINIPNIETLNISTKGAKSTVAIKSGNAGTSNQNHYKTINVKGNTDLTVKAESDRIEKFDASAFTATLDYTYKPLPSTPVGATNVVKGGSSKDIINLDFEDLAAGNKTNFEIDGGAGRDELNVKYLKATENKFTVNNVEKVDIHRVEGLTAGNKLHTMDFGGSDVTHLHTNAFKDNLKVTNSTIKSVTVDKVRPGDDGNVTAAPWGTTQFTNGYLEEINVTNTVDAQNPQGEAIIDPTIPGLRSVVSAYVSADQSEKVTVNIGKNVLAQKIAGNWIVNTTDRTHADNAIGIIAPKAKDITVNFNSPGTFGNGHANTTGISITNLSLADLTAAPTQAQKTQEKLTINSKSNILSNVDATFLEKLKVFNINTDTNFEAYAQRQFNDIQQINASGLASNNIKTGKVYFIDNIIGKGNGSGAGTADATQSIGIKAEHLNSFKANAGIFTKGNINVVLNDMQGNVEMVNGLNTSAVATNTENATHFENSFTNARSNLDYANQDASVVTEGTFRIQAWNITNLLVGNIIARDIDISAGNARGNVSLATGGSQYTTATSPYAGAVGKIGNEKTINNNIDMSQVAGSYTIGELFGQNIKFKSAVFNSPTYYSDQIDTGLYSDKSSTGTPGSTKNTIKANFSGARTNQDVISLEAKGVQSNTEGNTNVYVKFTDGTNSPKDMKVFKASGEKINLVINTKTDGNIIPSTQSTKLETIDLSEVKAGSTSWINLTDVKYSTDTSSHLGGNNALYSQYNNQKANGGFGTSRSESDLKNPLYDNGASDPTNFKATTTRPEWGGAHVAATDAPRYSLSNAYNTEQHYAREKSSLASTQKHDSLGTIKGTQGNDVVLLADEMKGLKTNGKINVDLGDGDDIIHVGNLADNTEVIIDGGKGNDLFDVSRSKTSTTAGDYANKIVTIKNIQAGDKIKLADYFAHGYDPDSKVTGSTGANKANYESRADAGVKYVTSNDISANVNSHNGTAYTVPAAYQTTSEVAGKVSYTTTTGGDKYEYISKFGDFGTQVVGSTKEGGNTTIKNTVWNGNGSGAAAQGYKGANTATNAPKFYEGTAADDAPQQTTSLVATAYVTPVETPPGSGNWPAPAGHTAANGTVAGTSTAKYMPTGSVDGSPHGHNGYFPAGTVFDDANNAFDGTTHTILTVGGVKKAYLTADNPVISPDDSSKVVKANTGKSATKHTPDRPDDTSATNLKKAVVVSTDSSSDKHDKRSDLDHTQMYDKHGITHITVKSKQIDVTHISGVDTLQQAVDYIINEQAPNRKWGGDATHWNAPVIKEDQTAFSNVTATEGAPGTNPTGHSHVNRNDNHKVITAYERTIVDDGYYNAHNDRLYAFSWKGDTYLYYDKKATDHGTRNDMAEGAGKDTIVKLAGVNLEHLTYEVDAKNGTITITSTDHFNG